MADALHVLDWLRLVACSMASASKRAHAVLSLAQVLVRVEKHWTQSDQERAYAVLAFVSQLLNSVFVLLLVNARTTALNTVLSSRTASSLALASTVGGGCSGLCMHACARVVACMCAHVCQLACQNCDTCAHVQQRRAVRCTPTPTSRPAGESLCSAGACRRQLLLAGVCALVLTTHGPAQVH